MYHNTDDTDNGKEEKIAKVLAKLDLEPAVPDANLSPIYPKMIDIVAAATEGTVIPSDDDGVKVIEKGYRSTAEADIVAMRNTLNRFDDKTLGDKPTFTISENLIVRGSDLQMNEKIEKLSRDFKKTKLFMAAVVACLLIDTVVTLVVR